MDDFEILRMKAKCIKSGLKREDYRYIPKIKKEQKCISYIPKIQEK